MADKARYEEKFFHLLQNPGALVGVVLALIVLVALFVFIAVALLKRRKLRPVTREIIVTAEEGKAVGGKGDKKKLIGEEEEEELGKGPIYLKGQFFTVSLTDDLKASKI